MGSTSCALGHALGALAARRDRGRECLSCIYGLGSPRDHGQCTPRAGPAPAPRRLHAQARGHALRPQRPRLHRGTFACARRGQCFSLRTRRAIRSSSLARVDSISDIDPCGRVLSRRASPSCYNSHYVQTRERSRARDRGHPRQSSTGRSYFKHDNKLLEAAHRAAQMYTWRSWPGWLLPRRRGLLALARRPREGPTALHADRLLRRTSCASSTKSHHGVPDRRISAATAAQGTLVDFRLSCPRRSTTGRAVRGVGRVGQVSVRLRHARGGTRKSVGVVVRTRHPPDHLV